MLINLETKCFTSIFHEMRGLVYIFIIVCKCNFFLTSVQFVSLDSNKTTQQNDLRRAKRISRYISNFKHRNVLVWIYHYWSTIWISSLALDPWNSCTLKFNSFWREIDAEKRAAYIYGWISDRIKFTTICSTFFCVKFSPRSIEFQNIIIF